MKKLLRRDWSLAARFASASMTLSMTLIAVGCATPVAKSSVEVPEHFAAVAASADEPETAWWESFGDPMLSDLVRSAARENRDIKMAAERVRAARAGETISRSWLLPNVGVVASGVDQSTGYNSIIKQNLPDIQGGSVGAQVSWEVDLSGRLRAGAAAATADRVAVQDGARGVRLLVATDIASNYFTLVGALRQLETVRAITAAQDETLRLVIARERVGLATPFDVDRARTDASRMHAAIPPLETLTAVSRHRIAVLLGDQAFKGNSITPSDGDRIVPAAQPGQPAALLERRPDLRAARAQLDAANARRRQARAEWFPSLFLNALFGRGSLSLNDQSIGAAKFSNAAALLAMPVFNAGRTQAINEVAKSNQSEAVLRYEDAIVRALEDVENALASLSNERLRAQALQNAAAAADSAFTRAQSLYNRGQIDLLALLDAERARLAVRMAANDSDTQLLLDSVQLFKALGGGWQVFEPNPQLATSATTGAATAVKF